MAWEIDTAHSSVGFAVKHMMVSTVRGSFKQFEGTIHLDEQNPAASQVDVTVYTDSIDTGDERRDGHLKSPDFFDAATYPTMTFTSTQVEKLSDEKFRVTGDLTIRGTTRQVPLEVELAGESRDMQGQRRAGFEVTGSLSRKEFGLNWNVALETGGWLVGDTVKLVIEAEVFEPTQAATPVAAEAQA
jgi:polyisoprenoid-binding protein YceI